MLTQKNTGVKGKNLKPTPQCRPELGHSAELSRSLEGSHTPFFKKVAGLCYFSQSKSKDMVFAETSFNDFKTTSALEKSCFKSDRL